MWKTYDTLQKRECILQQPSVVIRVVWERPVGAGEGDLADTTFLTSVVVVCREAIKRTSQGSKKQWLELERPAPCRVMVGTKLLVRSGFVTNGSGTVHIGGYGRQRLKRRK